MPHVSPQKVNSKVLEKIYKLIFSAITDRNISRKQQELAFNELLTPTEKIMLGKRIAAISMLSQGISCYKTGKILKLSPTTTAKLDIKIKNGKFLNTGKLCNILKRGPLQNYIKKLVQTTTPLRD